MTQSTLQESACKISRNNNLTVASKSCFYFAKKGETQEGHQVSDWSDFKIINDLLLN